MLVLSADIGGTHSRFAIFENNADSLLLLHSESYRNLDFDSFNTVIETFLDSSNLVVHSACLALATPINDEAITQHLTNIEWSINPDFLKKKYKLKHCILINDFSAIAHGLCYQTKKEQYSLQKNHDKPSQPYLFIGPGTGLGVALLLRKNNQTLQVLGSEAGHSIFSPEHAIDFEFSRFLAKCKLYPIWENILSGPGLVNLHHYILGQTHALSPQEITTQGLKNTGSTCGKTLSLFLSYLAVFSRNLALCTLPCRLYFCGNILNNIFPNLNTDITKNFLQHFSNHPTHHRYLTQTSIALILKRNIALYGAAKIAFAN